MKKRIFTMMMLLIAVGLAAEANPVDLQTAREVAAKFVNTNTQMRVGGGNDLQLVTSYRTANNTVAFRIFNTENGFVIVSADDCATPILGYSDEGRFDVNNIPPQMEGYLQVYCRQIEYGIEHRDTSDEFTAKQWNMLRTTGSLYGTRATTYVEPLLSETWNQNCYYNALCPEDAAGPCGHVYAGCAATAMGQIMHYWQYPAMGSGTHTYYPDGYPEQTVNFGATTYDWLNMPDYLTYASTSTQINAVATLLWHCGVAVNMMYGYDGSGAYSEDVLYALTEYFNYSDELFGQYKTDNASWLAMIKAYLDLSIPIYYSGTDTNGGGGHAFVCDGYDANDYLHFNWGWSGTGNNAYFALDALNVNGYQFNYYNYAIFNIHPEYVNTHEITTLAVPVEGGVVTGGGTYYEGHYCTLTAIADYNYNFVNWTKDGVVVSTDPVYNFVVSEDATYTANFDLFDGLTVGDGSANTNYYLPSYSFYCHSLTQQIYTPEDIEWAGAILSLGFYNDGGTKTQSYDIYIVNTDKTSFTSSYDWIPVTEEDLVFSGDVTMVSGGWTTIQLDNQFVYDGSTNLAIIIDNNTGSWTGSPHMACRVFGTDEVQAIRIYSDGTNYDPFNPYSYSGTLYNEKNQIRLTFDVDSSEPTIIPNPVAMGYRPNNAWMSPYKFQIYNPGNYTLINSISTDNPYFQVEDITFPFALGYHKSREISLTSGNGDGEMTGHLIINYGDNQTVQFDLSAIAYTPAIKDVWETAYEVPSFPYTDSIIVAGIPLYNNYNLPPTDTEDGADAVYKLVFTEDALLNASMTSGENGKMILYREGFNGEGGPMEENYYSWELNNSNAEPIQIQIGDGTGTTYMVPFNSLYGYSFSEQLFLANEIGATGNITSISFNLGQSYTVEQTNDVVLYMKNVTRETFASNTDYEPVTTGDIVFQGLWTIPAYTTGWVTITLDTPFAYDGESNLMVAMHESTSGYSTRYFEYTSVSSSGISYYSDSYNPDPYNLDSYSGSRVVRNNRNNIQLDIIPSCPNTITDMTVARGTYYLVTSSTSDAWGIETNTDVLSCPEVVSNPIPADYDMDVIPTAVQLQWSLGDRTTEYQLLLGTDYENLETIVDWTRNLTETYVVTGLLNNTNYFWQIKERNDGCPEGVDGPIWGFTTLLNGPQDLYAANYYLFEGDDLYLEWTPLADTNILSYNIYQDNVWIGNTTSNNFTVSGLTYNVSNGYSYHVTGVYAGGESNPTYDITIWVSGNGSVEGHVYEQDGITSIGNVTVTLMGYDEFGFYRTFAYTTDDDGYYTGVLKAGTYTATANHVRYQTNHYNGMVSIQYGQITEGIDILLDEVFSPVSEVFAEYYPDNQNPNSPYVKIDWVTNILYDFEDGSMQDWTNIDADGDGNVWVSSTNPGIYHNSGVNLSGTGHNNSEAYMISGSYSNQLSAALYPDNYLVSPQMVLGGSITFYACAQDAGYAAEHFGVAVSTSDNTNASSFTTIQEWTLTAKKSGVSTDFTRSGNRAQGAWYQYTVDLSSYAGQTGYVAIRHFDCYDQFILNIDDIIVREPNNTEPTRAFSHYRVYRTNAYNNGPFTEENTVLLADNMTETSMIDVTWQDAEHGVYKFGVSRVYEGNRESEIRWGELPPASHSFAYLPHVDADITGKEFHYARNIRTPWDLLATFYAAEGSQYGVASDGVNIYTCNWGYSSVSYNFYKYDMNGNVIEGFNIDGCGTIRDLTYDGQYFYGGSNDNILYCINLANKQLVSVIYTQCNAIRHCSYDPINDGFWVGSWSDLMLIDRNGNILQTAVNPSNCGGSGYYQAEDGSCHLYLFCESTSVYDYDIATNTISTSPIFDVSNLPGITGYRGGAFIGEYNGKMAFYCDIQQSPNLIGIYELKDYYNSIQGERESTIVWSNPMDKNMYLGESAVNVTVTLNSGDSPEGVLVQFTHLNPTEQALYPVADITLDANGYYAFESFRKGEYQVQVSFNDYYTITEEVSIWDATALTYMLNEINYAISNLYVSRTGWATWTDELHGNTVPSLDITQEQNIIFVNFEDSQIPADWTVIDGGSPAGYGWRIASSKIGSTGYGHNGSVDCILSQSYDNNYGIVYPDNYLVSPQVTIVAGSTFSFYACALDASYCAEHFGVFVSDNGISNWTMINEWTIGSKGERNNEPRSLRDHTAWTQYTVDLSAFTGQKYIAIRHFNCSDQFYLMIDDIELACGAKNQKGTKHFQQYQMICTDAEDNVVFDITTPYCFNQLPTDNLVDGETYHLKVAEVYSSGLGEWQEIDWTYQSCDNFETVTELNMEINEHENVIDWVYPEITARGNEDNRAMWDLMMTFNAAEGGHYGVAYDGDNFYTSNWGNSSCAYNFYKYDLEGNMLEGFNISGCGTLRGITYDGTNFYGVANSSTLYCVDLANHTVVNSFTSAYGAMRGITYDPVRDGFWVIGNWSGNLTLIDRTGAIQFTGPAPTSASDIAYYMDENNVEHIYCFNNGDNGVYDYNITTNAMDGSVFNFNSTPGATGSSGGCTVGSFNNKMAFIGNLQQSPNLIGVYELRDDYGNGYLSPVTGVLGAMVYRDGELLGFTTNNTYTDSIATGNHEYAIRVVYDGRNRCPNFNSYYAMSCPLTIGGTIYEVNVTSNPAQGGETTGSGSYINGFPCTVTATANEGYVFTDWVMNGEEVTNTPEYTFRVRDDIDMVANFIGFTPHWEVVDNPEYGTLSLIGIVNVDGEELTGNYMEVAALCGNECRGRQMLTYYHELGRFLVFMTVYGQEGDDITFGLYNHETGDETEFNCLTHLTFSEGVDVGTYDDPYIILFGIIQATAMQTGWNWYSTIVEQSGIEGLEMLEASLGNNGIMIKSQSDGFDINYGNLWMGNLESITNEQMYMINANNPVDAIVSGFTTNVADHPVTLYPGWTWLGYPNNEAVDINDALVELNASAGDILKSKQSFSTYIDGQGWYGTLNTLQPAMGMMYYSKRTNNTTFTYSEVQTRNELIPNLTAANNHWMPNEFEYPDNMSLMAVVELDNVELASGNYELAAFDNGRCIGSTQLIYVGPANRYMAFLTLSSEENHELVFGLYDAETGREYGSAEETVLFVPNDIVGNYEAPFLVHFDSTTGVDHNSVDLKLYPNPIDRGAQFHLTVSTDMVKDVTVEIVNAIGETVSTFHSSQAPISVKAPSVSGVYTVRVTLLDKKSYCHKLIVK